MIGTATYNDVDELDRLARTMPELGWVPRREIITAMFRNELIIATDTLMGDIVGFALFRHLVRPPVQTTLNIICVLETYRNQGVGRELQNAVITSARVSGKTYLQAKCPVNLPANGWYEHGGWSLHEVQPGKRVQLNVWRLSIV